MVTVPAGCFNANGTKVCLDSFRIGRYEVTVGQFRRFVNAAGYRTEAEKGNGCYVYNGSRWKMDSSASWKSPGFDQGENNPVACVSWNDAMEYIGWLNHESAGSFRLPTEAEWEYACRAGENHEYCGSNNVDAVAWHAANSDSRTHPVGHKQANAWGIYDMSGNVWEWTNDWYSNNYPSGSRNPQGALSGSIRIRRGGGWSNFTREMNALRGMDSPNDRGGYLGFRLAAPADNPTIAPQNPQLVDAPGNLSRPRNVEYVDGHTVYFGMIFEPPSKDNSKGAHILGVKKGSPAYKAGAMSGIVVQIDGSPITSEADVANIAATTTSKQIRVVVLVDGVRKEYVLYPGQ